MTFVDALGQTFRLRGKVCGWLQGPILERIIYLAKDRAKLRRQKFLKRVKVAPAEERWSKEAPPATVIPCRRLPTFCFRFAVS